MDKKILVENINKIHTTSLGLTRINKNLNLKCDDVISYIKDIILNIETIVYKKGKNYYVKNNDIIVTINASSFTIITLKRNTL